MKALDEHAFFLDAAIEVIVILLGFNQINGAFNNLAQGAFEYIESAPLLYDDQDPAVSRALFCINYCFGYAVPQSGSAQYAPISPQIVAAPLLAPSDLFKNRAVARFKFSNNSVAIMIVEF